MIMGIIKREWGRGCLTGRGQAVVGHWAECALLGVRGLMGMCGVECICSYGRTPLHPPIEREWPSPSVRCRVGYSTS